jgi:hypothetical protein
MMTPGRLSSTLLAALMFIGSSHGATLTVSTTGGNASSPLLYGLMFEVSQTPVIIYSSANVYSRISIILVS